MLSSATYDPFSSGKMETDPLLWPWGLTLGSGNKLQTEQTDRPIYINIYLALAELTKQRIPAKEN